MEKRLVEQEYSFNLTVPITDFEVAENLLKLAKEDNPRMRISRKPDRKNSARFYLSFPFSSARQDITFQKWFEEQQKENWELFGPTYGRWGLC